MLARDDAIGSNQADTVSSTSATSLADGGV